MWPRVVEAMLGVWLMLSPFIFRHTFNESAFWFSDLTCALAVVVLALLSFWRPARYAHVGIIAVGVWLVGFAYIMAYLVMNRWDPVPAALQNNLLVGFLLMMFALVPNAASLPPEAWRPFLQDDAEGQS